jgi:hypothetical protein
MEQIITNVDQTIMSLLPEERERLFRLVTDNIDIFRKIFIRIQFFTCHSYFSR